LLCRSFVISCSPLCQCFLLIAELLEFYSQLLPVSVWFSVFPILS
jgi:hypothetical protein